MKKILLSILLLLTLLPALKAQQLEEHLVTAGENNPLLKARYAEYQAALQRVPQVGTLPDPEANFSFFLRPMERYMGNQVGDVSVMQMFPWFGSLGAAKDEAKFMAQMKFSTFIEAKINLYHEVRTTWYTLYRIEKEVLLVEKELEIMQALERIALAKYKSPPAAGASSGSTTPRPGAATGSTGGGSSGAGAAGMAGMGGGSAAPATQGSSGGSAMATMGASSGGTMVDVILIRVQVKELENRLHLLRLSWRPQQVQFNNLLHRQPNLRVEVVDSLGATALPASLALLQDSIRLRHPMLQMYAWDEKARASQLRMAQLMGRPMIGLGVNYMVFQPRQDAMAGEMMGGNNMIMPMVSVSLPIYRKKYNAQRKEAEYAQQAASHKKDYTERQLFTELENLLYEYQRTSSTLQLLQEQVALNEQAIRLLTTNYTVAATGLEEVLRQRQNLLSYKQQQLQAVVDQHTAVSAIRRLMSSDE